MDKLWRGAFLNPIMKHYRHVKEPGERHPEELPEHIQIDSVEPLDDYEIALYDLDDERGGSELVQIGNGSIPWLVTMSFVADGTPYEFVIWSNKKPDPDSLRYILASYFNPE